MHSVFLLIFKVSIGKNEQIALTPLLMAQNTRLVHQETSDSDWASSGQVNLSFPCLTPQPRRCEMIEISAEFKSRPFQKDSKIKIMFYLLILPSSNNMKRYFRNILSDSLPSYIIAAGIKQLCSPKSGGKVLSSDT